MAKKTKRQILEELVSLRQPEEKSLEVFSELFAPQMKSFENSPRARVCGITDNDKRVLGECLTNYMLESNNQANLGLDPVLALNVITAVFGNSVLPLFTSEQPLQDKQGVIYFENIVAKSTRGNVEAGKKLAAGASAKEVYPVGYASDELIVAAVDGGAHTAYTATLGAGIRKQGIVVRVNQVPVAVDNGVGTIAGMVGSNGVTGTVNYTSGAVTLTFAEALAATDVVEVIGATDFENDGSAIPKINVEYDSKIVKAHTYLLQADTSILASYISKKRLGVDANKRAIEVLQQQILREITNDAIKKIARANTAYATRTTNFATTPASGVSIQAHYNSYNLTHADVQNKMAQVSGRGNFGAMIADPAFCAFLTGLNEFKQEGTITDDPSFFGTLGGRYGNIKVVRAPQLGILDGTALPSNKTGQAFCVYQNSKTDAAAVFAPFMPVMVTNDIPVSDNLTQRRSLIASMATTEVVVDKYIQQVTLSA